MELRKKISNGIGTFIGTIILLLFVLEISYRFQWFDYYKAEFKDLNAQVDLNSSNPRILICGDSFTAFDDSYVKNLREELTGYTVINAAVPGSGILQHVTYIPKRIKKYKPNIFIYQFYVGNDLFDISHPTGSPGVSLFRRGYWAVSDRFLGISYLNFRFAGVKYHFFDDAGGNEKPKEKEKFSPDNYSKREKLNYRAEPGLVENTLYLENGRKKDWTRFKKKFRKMIHRLPDNCQIYFMVIPHQSQVNLFYWQNNQLLGAKNTRDLYTVDQYPLYEELEKFCKELNMTMIDPLSDFRMLEEKNIALYYANDPHLNKSGQVAISQLLLSKMNVHRSCKLYGN